MVPQTIQLKFEGYWQEPYISSIPAQSGIYCVYACEHNVHDRTVSLKRLIYIGESENVWKRIAEHEKWQAWRRYLKARQQLCFNFTPASHNSRVRAEAACIYEHKPPENTEYINTFPFGRTTVTTSGRNVFLKRQFTVNPPKDKKY